MSRPCSPRSRLIPAARWWLPSVIVVVVLLCAVWGWEGRRLADTPVPPVQDIGAFELPLTPARDGLPPEVVRPRPVFALHLTDVQGQRLEERRFPEV
jgi:hypothetical protein